MTGALSFVVVLLFIRSVALQIMFPSFLTHLGLVLYTVSSSSQADGTGESLRLKSTLVRYFLFLWFRCKSALILTFVLFRCSWWSNDYSGYVHPQLLPPRLVTCWSMGGYRKSSFYGRTHWTSSSVKQRFSIRILYVMFSSSTMWLNRYGLRVYDMSLVDFCNIHGLTLYSTYIVIR